jgi:hypothetical protein
MATVLFEAATYFDLTVERARFLLDNCYRAAVPEPMDKVDLTITDWCR